VTQACKVFIVTMICFYEVQYIFVLRNCVKQLDSLTRPSKQAILEQKVSACELVLNLNQYS